MISKPQQNCSRAAPGLAAGGISQQSWQSELKELEANLALSTAPWKIVIGHHPVFSSGSGHGGSPELITNLKPILQQYGAQVGRRASAMASMTASYVVINLACVLPHPMQWPDATGILCQVHVSKSMTDP